jgi:non-heme chloroperoxidase
MRGFWVLRRSEIARHSGLQAEVFKKGVPGARVVILPNASHFIYQSNEVDVLREMRAFLTSVE